MAWISFGTLPCRGKNNLTTACVSMLLKSRASLDILPFSLCNKKKTCNSAHEQTPLSTDTIDSVLRHREVGRAKELLEPLRIYKTSSLVCMLCMIYLSGQECYTRKAEKREFSGLVCRVREYIYIYIFKSCVANKFLEILQIWNFRNRTNQRKLRSRRNSRQVAFRECLLLIDLKFIVVFLHANYKT